MKNMKQVVLVVALVSAVGVVFALKQRRAKPIAVPTLPTVAATIAEKSAALPRMVDLGSDKCVPCKMMAPILEELKTTQVDRLNVEFVDIRKNPEASRSYGVRVIPTQIFYAADGQELFRHEGFFSKEDIVAKWKEFGVELSAGTPQ